MRTLFIFLLAVTSSTHNLFAQTCTKVVAGSDFTPTAGHESDYYYHLNFIQEWGPSGNFISTPATLANDVVDFQGANFVYAATSNPRKLRDDFVDVEDSMLVIKLQTTSNKPLFNYKVNGLKPGSAYTIKLKVYHLPEYNSTCHNNYKWQQTTLRIGLSDDQVNYNGLTDFSLKDEANSWGQLHETTINGTLGASQSSINFWINTGYNFHTCSAIGIADLEIIGCLDPKVKSSQGDEVCTGEQTLLTLDREYNATNYLWEKSINGGGTWSTLGSTKSVVDEITGNSLYRATVDGIASDPYAVSTITCCLGDNGQPSSREVVFFDDFGRFQNSNTYEDAFGNVTTGLTAPFRSNTSYTIPGHTYQSTGPVNDGFYAVSSYMAKNVADYLGKIPEDHSQETDGGYLLINVGVGFKGVIYDRLITGLCEGKELYFDAYVGNASDASPPVITLNIKSPDGSVTLRSATISPAAASGWNRIQVPTFTLSGYSSVRIEINSQGENWGSGNDLVIDDIKFMACAPPTLDLFADMTVLVKELDVCDEPVDLGIVPSDLLTNFFDGTPNYLLQWSMTPTVDASWANIGSHGTTTAFNLTNPESSYFAGKNNGDKVYLRVIAATETIFNSTSDFTNPIADANNYCKNFSVSPYITLTLNCPSCVKADDYSITPGAKGLDLCQEELQTTLSVGPLQVDGVNASAGALDITWYKGASIAAGTVVKATAVTNSSTFDVTYAEAGTYFVRVRDVNMASEASCYVDKSVTVVANAVPTPNASSNGPVCVDNTTLSLDVTDSPSGTYQYAWTGPNSFTSNAKSPAVSSVGTPATLNMDGTYNVKVTDSKGCTAADDVAVIINANPTVSAGSASPICKDSPSTLTATSTTATAFAWSNATGVTFAPVARDQQIVTAEYNEKGITSDVIVTYTVTVSDANSCSATDDVTVSYKAICNPRVAIASDASNDSVCEGGSVTLTADTTGNVLPLTDIQWSNATWNGSYTTPLITPAATTTYTCTVTDSEGSEGTGEIVIFVNPLPTASIPGASACAGDPATLTVSTNGNKYKWDDGATVNTITASPALTTTYTVTVTDGKGCSSDALGVITINDNPTVDAGSDFPQCKDNPVNLAPENLSNTQYTWSANSSDVVIDNAASPTTSISYFDPPGLVTDATYDLYLTVQDLSTLCYGYDTLKVTFEKECLSRITIRTNDPTPCLGDVIKVWGEIDTNKTIDQLLWNHPSFANNSIDTVYLTPGKDTTIEATLSDIFGGVSTDQLAITVHPLPVLDAGTGGPICLGASKTVTASGGPSYLWNTGDMNATITFSPGSTTTYTLTVTDGNNCSASDTLVVQVNPLPTAEAGTPQTICPGNNTSLDAAGGQTYLWSTGETNEIITVSPPNITATYTVTAYNQFGCSDESSVVISFFPSPVPSAGQDASFCAGRDTILTASGGDNPGGSYLWNTGESGKTISVSSALNTTYTVTVTDGTSGCQGTDDVVVTVKAIPTVDVGQDVALCSGASATLSSTGNGEAYRWTGGLTGSPTVTPTVTTTYTATVYSSGFCTNTDDLVVTVNPNPTAGTNGDQVTCPSKSVTLAASGGGTYLWSNSVGTDGTVSVSPQTTTTYVVTVTNSFACTDMASATITVTPPPAPPSIQKLVICSNDLNQQVVQLTGYDYLLFYDWYDTPAGGTARDTGYSYTLQSDFDTALYVEARTSGGCTSTSRTHAHISIEQAPDPGLVTDPEEIYERSATVFASTAIGASRWFWKLSERNKTYADSAFTHEFLEQGRYSILQYAYSKNNCWDSIRSYVEVLERMEVFVPDIFTPNFDGLNDRLEVKGPVTDAHIVIYNQWGFKVFESSDLHQGWDGTYNGHAQPQGNYTYYLEATTMFGTAVQLSGIVALVR